MRYKYLGHFDDVYYDDKPLNDARFCSRGIILNKENKIAIIHVRGNDDFGVRDYYELPGGGLENNESYESCLIREMQEELGVNIDNIIPLGVVSYDFKKIGVHNIAMYYVGRVCGEAKTNYTKKEKKLFASIEWYELDDLILLLETYKTLKVGIQIRDRELCVLKEYKANYLNK